MAKRPITVFNDDDWYIYEQGTYRLVGQYSSRLIRPDEIRAMTLPGCSYNKGFAVRDLPLWQAVPDITRKAVAYSNGATELQQVITPIAALPGQFSVSYGSQYFGAKNPEGLHRKLQFVTNEAGLRRLAENLLSFCNTR